MDWMLPQLICKLNKLDSVAVSAFVVMVELTITNLTSNIETAMLSTTNLLEAAEEHISSANLSRSTDPSTSRASVTKVIEVWKLV